MTTYNVALIFIVTVWVIYNPICGGPVTSVQDPFSWARADRLPIDANIAWLPCKYFLYIQNNIVSDNSNDFHLICIKQVLNTFYCMLKSVISVVK